MTTIYTQTLRRRIAEAEARYETAKARGETETYLALARFEIDQLKSALEAEEHRGAA